MFGLQRRQNMKECPKCITDTDQTNRSNRETRKSSHILQLSVLFPNPDKDRELGCWQGGGGGVDAQLKEIEPGSVIDRWQESGQISSKTWYEFRGKTQLVFRVRALTLPAKVMDWYVFKWPSRTLLQWERVNPKQNIQRICLELEDIKWGS